MYNFSTYRGMRNIVDARVKDYMNAIAKDKTFTTNQVAVIRTAIIEERKDRIFKKLCVNSRTKAGKKEIDCRAALIANKSLNKDKVTAKDIRLYKKCRIWEYEEGTGKCAWGFSKERVRRGFDPDTGLEID